MTIDALQTFLGWCAVINGSILLLWFMMFVLAHDWIYGIHGKWFRLSKERFDEIHYKSMSYFKLSIFLFNLAPYLALHLIA